MHKLYVVTLEMIAYWTEHIQIKQTELHFRTSFSTADIFKHTQDINYLHSNVVHSNRLVLFAPPPNPPLLYNSLLPDIFPQT